MPREARWRLVLQEGENMLATAPLASSTRRLYGKALMRFGRYMAETQDDPTIPSVYNVQAMTDYLTRSDATTAWTDKAALRWLVRNVLKDGQLLLELQPKVTRADGRTVRLFGPEDLRRIVDAASADPEMALIVGIMRWYLRPVALTRMTWSGIAHNPYTGRATITVRDKGRAPGKLRTVQTTRDGRDILQRYRDFVTDEATRHGCTMPEHVWVWRRGHQLRPHVMPDRATKKVRRLFCKLNLHGRPYDLRHSFGRLGFEGLRAQGYSFSEALQLVSLAMGHEDIVTTRRYLHLTSEETVVVLDAQDFDMSAPVTVERKVDLRFVER